MLGSKQASEYTLPFPVPAAPPPRRPTSSFPFPPPPSNAHSVTTKVPRERQPMWTVPGWVPLPLEGLAYLLIGTLIGTIIMLGVVKLIRPAHLGHPSDDAVVVASPQMAQPVAVAARH